MGALPRGTHFSLGNEVAFGELLRRRCGALGFQVLRIYRGNHAHLVQALGVEVRSQAHELRLCSGELALRFEHLELYVWVAEDQEDGTGVDPRSGVDQLALNPSRGDRRYPADLLRNKGARPPNLAEHRSP